MPEILKSRTFWVGLAMFIVAGLHAIRKMIPILSTIPDDTWREIMDAIQAGGIGLIGIFLRLALERLKGGL